MSELMQTFEALGHAFGRGLAAAAIAGNNNNNAAPIKTPPPGTLKTPSVSSRGRPPAEPRACKHKGCAGTSRSKGLCSKHYQAARRAKAS